MAERIHKTSLSFVVRRNRSYRCGSTKNPLWRILLFASFLGAAAGPVFPQTAEIGLEAAGAYRSPDRFDRGMEKYRTSVNPSVLSDAQADAFRTMQGTGFWLRLGNIIDENQFIGFTLGNYSAGNLKVTEIRSDGTFTETRWFFKIPYFMFLYHYRGEVPFHFLRGWNWELGGGFGFAYNAFWNVNGSSISSAQIRANDSHMTPSVGNVYRLEGALYKRMGDTFFFRGAIRFSYAYLSGLQGSVNGSSGTYYFMKDSSLVGISPSLLFQANALTIDPLLGPVQSTVIRRNAIVTAGMTELVIGAGIRIE